jgi:hypothetical protein
MNIIWKIRNFIRDNIFNPIWFRIFGQKHHIVRTKLKPAPWYDTDTRMLYAVMSLVEWYVENDMSVWSDAERNEEIERIKSKEDDKYLFGSKKIELDVIQEQFSNQDEILKIYGWWKNYNNRKKEIDEALHKWHDYVSKDDKDDKDVCSFLNKISSMTGEQKEEETRLNKALRNMETKLSEEEQHMMKRAVELRYSMWS